MIIQGVPVHAYIQDGVTNGGADNIVAQLKKAPSLAGIVRES